MAESPQLLTTDKHVLNSHLRPASDENPRVRVKVGIFRERSLGSSGLQNSSRFGMLMQGHLNMQQNTPTFELIFVFQAYPEYLITYQIVRPEGMVDG